MEALKSPELPNEIWQRIFRFAILPLRGDDDNYIQLWTSARQVSRNWRSNIAQAYLDTIIRNPKRCDIFFHFGDGYTMELFFDRMREGDKSRVVFKEKGHTRRVPQYWSKSEKAAHKRRKYKLWKEAVEDYNSGYILYQHQTSHIINLNGPAMDTALPGLEVDPERFEMSFEWEGLLTAFLSEQAEFKRRFAIAEHSVTTKLKSIMDTSLQNSGKADWFNVFNTAYEGISDVTKEVRRDRIRRKACAEDEWVPTFEDLEREEKDLLKRMEHSAFHGRIWEEWRREEARENDEEYDSEEWEDDGRVDEEEEKERTTDLADVDEDASNEDDAGSESEVDE